MQNPLPIRPLREWRTSVFFENQIEFAERIVSNVSTLSLWENERRIPRIKTRRLIAERLGLQPQQIAWPEVKDRPVAA